jgi:AraC family transcriptional regulator
MLYALVHPARSSAAEGVRPLLLKAQGSPRSLVLAHDVFFGDLRLSRSLDGITLSHRIANSPPEEVELHTHVEAHFVLITSGRYVSSARGAPNQRTTLIYNPPGTTHRDCFFQGRGSFFTISISTGRLAEFINAGLQPVAMHLKDERACGLAVALLMECARWDTSSRLKAEALCSELFSASSYRSMPLGKSPPSWLRTAYELIQDCHGENPGIRHVAKAVGVHHSHLARAFRVFLGCTPGDLLRARRLEKAAALLMQAQSYIADIALDSGFSDQQQFAKAFRRVYGIPPGGYRRLSTRRNPARRDVAF